MSATELTGRWVGHYAQWGRQYPITADLVQAGEQLSGAMRDGHPDREYSVFEVASEAGLPPGADEQIEQRVRELLPDAPSGPVRYVSRLPTDSDLKGRFRELRVYFLKTYQGDSFGGYRLGEHVLGTERPGHGVHYEGRLSPDGQEIEGRWWIDADPARGIRRTEGAFSLRRAADS